jgi:hypothetical protein
VRGVESEDVIEEKGSRSLALVLREDAHQPGFPLAIKVGAKPGDGFHFCAQINFIGAGGFNGLNLFSKTMLDVVEDGLEGR